MTNKKGSSLTLNLNLNLSSIGLIPQDNRPVSQDQPILFAEFAGFKIITPPSEILGQKTKKGQPEKLLNWLGENASKAAHWILSLDMLFYGGLVASRKISESRKQIFSRIELLKSIQKKYPKILFSAFQSIRRLSGTVTKVKDLPAWEKNHAHDAFQKERERNHQFNIEALKLVSENILTELHLLQEDARPNGPQLKEQTLLKKFIQSHKIQNHVQITTGTDEAALVMIAKTIYQHVPIKNNTVKTKIICSHPKNAKSIALYEDSPLQKTINGQLQALAIPKTSKISEATFLCMVWCPNTKQRDLVFDCSYEKKTKEITNFIQKIQGYLSKQKRVVLLDLAYANGADPAFTATLVKSVPILQLSGYAAWNTAANTAGFGLAQGLIDLKDKDFLRLRLMEDWGYQAVVRPLLNQFVTKNLKADIWNIKSNQQKKATNYLTKTMQVWQKKQPWLTEKHDTEYQYELPWNRTFEIKITPQESYDVIVVGAGTSGLCAAIAAARNNAKTLLIEKTSSIGGALTRAMVYPMMGFHATPNLQIIKGIPEEIIQLAQQKKGSPGHIPDPIGCAASITPVEPDILEECFEELLAKAHVDVLKNTTALSVLKEKNKVTGIVIQTQKTVQKIFAKILVDATGNADIAVKSKASFVYGREKDHKTQPMSLMFTLSGVDRNAIINYIQKNPKEFVISDEAYQHLKKLLRLAIAGFFSLIKEAQKKEKLCLFRDRVLGFETQNKGEMLMNMTRISHHDPTNPDDLKKAYELAKKQIKECCYVLQKYIPGFHDAQLKQIASEIGIRETRHIQGEYTLTAKDVLTGQKFSDGIACGAFPIDIHSPDNANMTIQKMLLGTYYAIPYRCLIPKKIDSLFVTGRAISATHEASASARMAPTCMALGQAAGTAGAICALKNLEPKNLNPKNLRKILLKQNTYL